MQTNSMYNVKIKKFHPDALLPEYKSAQAAAMDLYAIEDVNLFPGTRTMVGTGIGISLPFGFEAQIRARSGMASKGIIVLNGPGTIDEDYTAEIKVLLGHLGTLTVNEYLHNEQYPRGLLSVTRSQPYEIRKGDRIAQICIAPVYRVVWNEVEELAPTERGGGGFGSSGR